MSAQKFTKKELKQDSFVTGTEKALEYLQKNATAVGIVLLVVVVLLVGGTYLKRSRTATAAEASYLLYQGQSLLSQGDYELAMASLQDCIDKHGNSEYGRLARVGMVQAMLGLRDVDGALARIDQYAADVPSGDPAAADLSLLRATALADAGRFAEAAEVLGGLIAVDLPDAVYYDRSVRRAEWLQAAGQHDAALNLLTELKQAVAAGELEIPGADLDNRLEVARALGK